MIQPMEMSEAFKCLQTCSTYNNVFKIVKVMFLVFNVVNGCLTISFVIAGLKFISLEAFKLGQLHHLRDDVQFDFIIQGLFSILISASGIYIMCTNKSRKYQNFPIAIYAFISLVLGITCIVKGGAVMVLEMMNEERFEWACRATP